LVLNIMTAVSQWEREAIGERTRDAMSHKRTNGERGWANIKFGYRLCAESILLRLRTTVRSEHAALPKAKGANGHQATAEQEKRRRFGRLRLCLYRPLPCH
jgi:DNA invertase Pin-like site-specific DNA recombinase